MDKSYYFSPTTPIVSSKENEELKTQKQKRDNFCTVWQNTDASVNDKKKLNNESN